MYSNLPINIKITDSATSAFNSYTERLQETDPTVYGAMVGFFGKRGFDVASAESVATILYSQSKKDGYQPMQILDTLKGFDDAELSALIAEILNYNRYKTSNLGKASLIAPNPIVQRNIIA
jgi:hypothetical protein